MVPPARQLGDVQQEVLRLQQSVGNQAVVQLLRTTAGKEREVAAGVHDAHVVHMASTSTTTIQRKPKLFGHIKKGWRKLRKLVKPRRQAPAQADEPVADAPTAPAQTAPVDQDQVAPQEQGPGQAEPAQQAPGPGDQILVDVPTEGVHVRGDVLFVDGTPYSLQNLQEKQVGVGGFGIVYKLMPRDPDAGPPLVLKAPKANVPEHHAAIENEAETATALGEHPNLATTHGMVNITSPQVELYDLYPFSPTNVVIMEFLGGGSLHGWIGRTGFVANALRAGRITYQEYVGVNQYIEHEIVKGLKHMHEQGFGHFDIKPENVMFDGDFNIKLIDLGGAFGFGTPGVTPTTSGAWESPEFKAGIQAGGDLSSALTEAYDAYGMGLWSNQGLEAVRDLKDPKHGPPAPGPGPADQRGTRLAAEQYVGEGMSTDASQRSVANLAKRAYLRDPLIDADQAREVLRFVSQWKGNKQLEREKPAPSAREDVARPGPVAPEQKPLPFLGELLARALTRGEIELQAEVPQAVLETSESSEEAETATG